jgi:uncharacterized protein (DUF608 family)
MNRDSVAQCSDPACGCSATSAQWQRRSFLKAVGAGAGALALKPWQLMAGPFTRADFSRLVPEDKKLQAAWVKSLTERGVREEYHGEDLDRIGMPVGGLCAGQVYLGGDGRLWHWDIFNFHQSTGAEHYAKPLKATAPFAQGFAVRVTQAGKSQVRPLDRQHWKDVSFIGEYPIGYVSYRDATAPVSVALEAFSPFIPLNTEDSSLPATVLEFTVKNESGAEAEVVLGGWLENALCLRSAEDYEGLRRNRLLRQERLLYLACSAEPAVVTSAPERPDILFEDFEHETYGNWTVTGTAFGPGPVEISKIHPYQGDVAGHGKRVVNTHASAPGNTVEERDQAKGTLTSPPFPIERHYITFLCGGGSHKGKTCVNLLVGDKIVLSATGHDNNRMSPVSWNVRRWAGKTAKIEIVDQESGGWGNIGVDDIVFSDRPRQPLGPLADAPDFGTMGLALLDAEAADFGHTSLPPADFAEGATAGAAAPPDPAKAPFGESLVGALARKWKLAPGATAKAAFVVSWHLPNLKMDRLPHGRHYATRFDSALSVANYVAREFLRLTSQTRLWHDTWYDSTLPYWLLDRSFLNTSILATSTCFRFGDGRFYAWEGVGCCAGTCGHVWQYAHAVARVFPDLEHITREKVDFGLALQKDGAIFFRGEFNNIPAIDAQAGTILRALREHQMSADDAFLQRTWPGIKRATEWLIAKDADGDGLITSNQHNTLDTDWFGPVAWLSGLYLAALLAAEAMAQEMGDGDFAAKCRGIFNAGQKNLVQQLYDGEYFINKPDPKHLDAINSGSGCEIDQVFGQSWAWQVGLPRVLPQPQTLSALRSLWRYNFTPDVGPYRAAYKAGRWYAMPGEAGLLMCSFPRADWDYAQAAGKGPDWAAGYFNECMNGFEYQVAGHMIWEGLLTQGLAIARAVHDRYHASRRNPWNEVECGDHYARSMASYGVFLAACGYSYHGPKGHLAFNPRLASDQFKCPFTAAEGWGSFAQTREPGVLKAALTIKHGKLRLRSLSLPASAGAVAAAVKVLIAGQSAPAKIAAEGDLVRITLEAPVEIQTGQTLEVAIA